MSFLFSYLFKGRQLQKPFFLLICVFVGFKVMASNCKSSWQEESVINSKEEMAFQLADGNNLEAFKHFVQTNDIDLHAQDAAGDTFLHVAEDPKIMIFLLDQGLDIEVENSQGQSSLLQAMLEFNTSKIVFLVKKGADTGSDREHKWWQPMNAFERTVYQAFKVESEKGKKNNDFWKAAAAVGVGVLIGAWF